MLHRRLNWLFREGLCQLPRYRPCRLITIDVRAVPYPAASRTARPAADRFASRISEYFRAIASGRLMVLLSRFQPRYLPAPRLSSTMPGCMNQSGAHRGGVLAAVLVLALGTAASPGPGAEERPLVSVVTDRRPGPATSHGLGKLMAALQARGVSTDMADSVEAARGGLRVIAGLPSSDGPAAALLNASSEALPPGPESLLVRKVKLGDRPAWVIGGSDDRGLMYALLDVADRVSWSADPASPFQEVRDVVEKPAVPERTVSIYTMNRAYWESRFHDAAYWERYLDTLARNRFNSQFASFDEEAQMLIDGGETARTRPPETSRWLLRTAEEVLSLVDQARKRAGDSAGKELLSTLVDLRILAHLALFHARRIPAAVSHRLFERTGNPQALEEAIHQERAAVEAWRGLVASAGDVYAEDLMMGVRGAGLCGHWREELTALDEGLAALEGRRAAAGGPAGAPAPRYRPVPSDGDADPPSVTHDRIHAAPAATALTVSADVQDPSGIKWVRLRYRSVNQKEDYRTLPMLPAGPPGRYQATVPAEQVVPSFDFMYFIEAMDAAGNGGIYPNLNRETPYIVVRLGR